MDGTAINEDLRDRSVLKITYFEKYTVNSEYLLLFYKN
jgi:hypothetical protein